MELAVYSLVALLWLVAGMLTAHFTDPRRKTNKGKSDAA
jgi:hypothetical protein